MFIVRKLSMSSIRQLTINSLSTICKRNDVKLLSCLQAHTTVETCWNGFVVGTRYKKFLLPHRENIGKALNMATSVEGRVLTYDDIFGSKKHGDITLIDVREPSELKETGSMPDSINIPLGELDKALKASDEEFEKLYSIPKPNIDDQLVFSCRGGTRSAKALQKALDQGYSNAKNYGGGFLDYAEKSKKKTEL